MKLRFLLHDVFTKGGGVLTVTLALARDLSDRYDVELVSLFGGGKPVHPLPAGVPVTALIDRRAEQGFLRKRLSRIPTRVMPESEPRYKQYSLYSDLVLARYLRSLRDGAVVTMQPGLNIALARFGTDRYIRVAEDHRPFVERPRSTMALYEKYAGRLDAFLALTSEDTAGYERMLGSQTHVQTMTNGTPAWKGELSTLTEKVVVGAGRLERSKGFDLLIAAWAQVAAAHPDWRLRIYGDGSQRPELERQIDGLGLREQVSLEGFSTSLQAEMAKGSLFVLSSRAEGYGMVLVEAMACGVPVVSTDCPAGPRDIITSGVDGLLVPNKDVDALAGAIIEMIELDDDTRQKMAGAALAKADERSQEAVSAQWDTLLQELAARRGR
ncbi:MAG TPA: glycosyltransferase [Nocardioidaceae bacterium]|nr:glycosyltransferase [Nocardioidaceae bacterium]